MDLNGESNSAFDDDWSSDHSAEETAIDTAIMANISPSTGTSTTSDDTAKKAQETVSGSERSEKNFEDVEQLQSDHPVSKVSTILQDFMQTTTAHGWKNVTRHQNKAFNVVWLCMIVSALTLCVVQVSSLIAQYLRFPYEQRTDVQAAFISFPSVTVCNLQSVSSSTADTMLQNSSTNFSRWELLSNAILQNPEMNESANYDYWFDRLRGPQGFYDNIGSESRIVGHQQSDFIISCTFGKSLCPKTSFTYFSGPTNFNCYTFNGGNISADKVMSQASGPEAGLSLILYLEASNGGPLIRGPYYSFQSSGNSAGARVVIHSPDARPFPLESGLNAPPGHTTSVSMKVGVNRRLGVPYDHCISDPKQTDGGRFFDSMQRCLKSCEQSHVLVRCNCLSSALPLPDEYAGWPMAGRQPNFCGLYNNSDPLQIFNRSMCELETDLSFFDNPTLVQSCDCHPPCHELSYQPEVSYSYWPLEFCQESFFTTYVLNHENYENLKAYQNLGDYNLSELVAKGLIRSNFLRVNIYPQTLTVTKYEERETFTFFNLFSSIGGAFGLWIGMSLLTWMEVCELVIIMIAWGTKRLRRTVAETGRRNPAA